MIRLFLLFYAVYATFDSSDLQAVHYSSVNASIDEHHNACKFGNNKTAILWKTLSLT